jgi:hypothetical protein
MTTEQLKRENARLRRRLRSVAYGRQEPHNTSMTEKAPDGGAPLSESEKEVLHRMTMEGTL